ncbi:hypothetical protein GCM10010990_14320 [Croceicoccus mobilis]|uniref:Glycosyl transferase family 1 n=2 Tax=Croceicoccus mobilis TaxID=1703339 RepID=A0A917DTM4_9SPHN|nr:hypothetical protein GCM10010990_14320 [Croceicoccus mobilis]
MMKILLCSHSPDNRFAGASRIYHLLAASLRERGHEVEVYHGEDAGITGKGLAAKLKTRFAMPRLVSALGRKLQPERFDVVMTSSGTGAPLYRHLRKNGGPRPLMINHIHGLGVYDDLANRSEEWIGNWPTSRMYKLFTGRAQKRWDWEGVVSADLTIVQNLRALDWVERRLPQGREAAYIPAAVHPELLKRSADVDESLRRDDMVVWFASWEARKGAAYVPRAFRKLREARPEMRLVVAGVSVPVDEILDQFDPRDRENVEVPGYIAFDKQVELFSRAAIILFPSVNEGFGLALIEAMAFGPAAVSSNVGFGADFIEDRGNGRIVQNSSIHMARAMIELVENPEERRRMAAKGRMLARSLTMERMTDAYEREMEKRLPA